MTSTWTSSTLVSNLWLRQPRPLYPGGGGVVVQDLAAPEVLLFDCGQSCGFADFVPVISTGSATKTEGQKNTSKPYTANVGPWLTEASRGLKRVKPNGCTTGVSKPTTNDRFPRVVCGGSCDDSRTQISLTLGSCRQRLKGGSMRRILSPMCDELEHLERGWLVL